MSANAISTFNKAIKIVGTISTTILATFALLVVGIALGHIEPNGSVIEKILIFLVQNPLVVIIMSAFALWALILFWRKK